MNDDKTLQSLIELAKSGSMPIAEAMQKAYEYGMIAGNIHGIKIALETFSKEPA